MRADHVFRVIDAHAGGAPARLVLSGIPPLSGDTVMAKMQDFSRRFDWIRTSLVLEPRGTSVTSAIVMVPPTDPRADLGAFFMEAHGYLPMCGSDIISGVTALVESGQLPATGAERVVRVETPAGLIEATAAIEAGRVTAVRFVGAPAFRAVDQGRVDLPGIGKITVDVAYGGNFYAITDARQFGLALTAGDTAAAVAAARQVRDAVNDAFEIVHPDLPQVRGVSHVQFFIPPQDPADPTQVMVVMATGVVDRSPCGTGTTAKVATLMARGELILGQRFTHRSATGAMFTGRAVELATVGGTPACRVEISGTSYVTADSTIYVDRTDVLADGIQFG